MSMTLGIKLTADGSQAKAEIVGVQDSLGRLHTTASKPMDAGLNTMEAAARQASSVVPGLGRELQQMGSTGGAALQFTAAQVEALKLKFDPAYAAAQRLTAQTKELSTALSAGAITQQQHAQLMRQMTQAHQSAGASMGQIAQATRQLPLQMQDIFVSLQGGMSPLTVFMQQGSQIAGSYGSAGLALKSVASYLVAMVNPLSIAAAAVAALGLAYFQGSKETDAYRLALLNTGNAAGTSTAQMADMARSMGSAWGVTQGAAAEALAAMASTGRVGSASLREYSQVAIDMEKSFGVSLADTAKHFAELGKDPVGASVRLNESMNYLTASTYAQIKAAADNGEAAKAAALAQDAYAQAMKGRAAEVVTNLGYMERAWAGIKNVAKETWDAMLGVGRSSTPGDALAKATKQLADREASLKEYGNRGGVFGDDTATQVAKLKDEVYGLQELERQQKRAGTAAAERAEAEKKGIAAIDAVAKANEKGVPKQEQMNKALKDYRENLALAEKAGVKYSAEQIKNAEAAIREQFKVAPPKKTEAETLEKQQAKAYAELVSAMQSKVDAARLEAAQTDKLTESQKQQLAIEKLVKDGKISARDASSAKTTALIAEMKAAEDLKRTEAFRKAQSDADDKALESLQKEVEALRKATDAMSLHNSEIGLTTEQLNALRLQRLDNEIATQAGIVAEYDEARALGEVTAQMQLQILKLDELKKKRGLTAEGQQAQVAVDAAKKAADEWKKTADKIETSLTDALMRGFESGKGFGENMRDTLVNMFKTMVLRPVIQATVNAGLTAMGLGAPGGGGGGSSGLMGGVNDAMSLYSMGSTAFTLGSQYAAGTMSAANVGATIFGNTASVAYGGSMEAMLAANGAFGTAAGGTAAAAGAGTAAGAGATAAAGSSAMASMAAAAPYIAAALAVYQLAKTLDTSGTIHTGGGAAYSASTGVQRNIGQGITGFAYTDRRAETETMAAGVAQSIVGLLDSTATAFGKTAGYTAATAFADDSSRDGAWGSLVLSKAGKDLLNWADTRQSRWAPREFADGEDGVKQYMTAVSKDVRDMLIAETPAWADAMLQALGDAPTLDQLAGVVQQITAIQNIFKNFGDAIPQLKGLSDDAVGSLMALAGGVGNLQQGLATYQNLFYTEAEKQAFATKQVADAMANLGLAMPENDVAFRKLVEAQDVNTEAGRRQWTALIALAPAFDQVTAAAQKAAEAAIAEAQARAKAIADERAGLQNQLDQAMGNTAALRERERNAIDESNRALYDQIKALELQKTAAEAAAAVDQERQGLQDQIDQMLGNTAALRARERAALSEANRALYDHIKAIEDQRAALQAAVDSARATTDAAMRALQAAVSAEKAQWDATLRTAQGRVSDLTGLLSSITRTVSELLREATAVPVSRAQGQAWLDAAVSTAKAGGQLPTEAKLSEVVQGLRQSMGQTLYKSQADEDRDKLLLAIKLNDLSAIAGNQLSDAEKQLQAAQTQITRLDELLRAQQAQLDAARGNAASTLSVADAIKSFAVALSVEFKALAASVAASFVSLDLSQDGLLSRDEFMKGMDGKASDSELKNLFAMLDANGDGQLSKLEAVRAELIHLNEKWVTTGTGASAVSTYTSSGGAVATQTQQQKPTGAATITDITGASYSTQDVINYVNQQLAAGNPRAVYDEAVKRGISSTSLDRLMGWSAGTALKWATDNRLPAFADGGSYKGGLALVGERGPELINFAQPGQVYNARQTQQILGGGGQNQEALLDEVRALRAEVQGLRHETRATALHASKTADILDRATQGEDALRTREVAA